MPRNIVLTPGTVRWARIYRGVSEKDAAKALGNSIERLNLIETIGAPLTAGEFRKLAATYRLPEATLAMPAPPPVPPEPEDFRTLEGRDATLSKKTREAISTAQVRQLQLTELRELLGEKPPRPLRRIDISEDPEEVARSERQTLKFSETQQSTLGDAHAMFGDLRSRVEDGGVSVYALSFPLDDCRGFSVLGDDLPAAIVVNSKDYEWSARNFTLMHEYGHLLLHRPGISDQRNGNRVERWCNKFAAAFLMPKSLLGTLQGPHPIEPDFEALRRMAGSIGVSQQALALRLQELRIASKDFYERVLQSQEKHKSQPKPKKSGGSYINTTLFSFGPQFTNHVAQAYGAGRISPVGVARIMQLSPEHLVRATRALR